MHIEGEGPGPGSSAQPNPNAHLKDAVDVTCESCGGNVFEEKMMMKKVSKFVTGSDRDSITPIPVIACSACNHVNEMFIPKF